MEATIDILLYLSIYSFMGWVCETIYCSVGQGHFINRGFLAGPFCPIYGFGALAILYTLSYLPHTVTGVFLGAMFITSLLEYVTGWAMEKIFHQTWWDYSNRRFNIHGRVCLRNSTLFGLLGLVLFFDIHPKVSSLLTSLSFDLKLGFLIALGIYLTVDFITTLYRVLGINKKIQALGEVTRKLQEKYQVAVQSLSLQEIEKKAKELNLLEHPDKPLIQRVGLLERRLLSAFPDMVSKTHKKSLEDIKNLIASQKAEKSANKRKTQ